MFVLLHGDGAHHRRHHFVLGTHVCTVYATFDKAAEHVVAFGIEEVVGEGVRVGIWITIDDDIATHRTFVVAAPQEAYLWRYSDRVAQTEGGSSAQGGIHDQHIVLWNQHVVALCLQDGACLFVGASAVELGLALNLLIHKPFANLGAVL